MGGPGSVYDRINNADQYRSYDHLIKTQIAQVQDPCDVDILDNAHDRLHEVVVVEGGRLTSERQGNIILAAVTSD